VYRVLHRHSSPSHSPCALVASFSQHVFQRICFSRATRDSRSPEPLSRFRVTSRVFTIRLLKCFPEVFPRSRPITSVICPDRLNTPHKNGPTILSGRAPATLSLSSCFLCGSRLAHGHQKAVSLWALHPFRCLHPSGILPASHRFVKSPGAVNRLND
jgi:hypothetical protein